MRLIKISGFVTIAAAVAAVVGVSSATAESTLLCETDNAACNTPSLVHFLSVKLNPTTNQWEDAKVKLLTPLFTIECNALIEAHRTSAALPATGGVVFEGLQTYANCGSCTVTVIKTGSITALRLGVELADITATGFVVKLNCSDLIECDYDATNLVGHGLGGLTTPADANGRAHVTFTEALLNVHDSLGTFGCPATANLTALFQSLNPLYMAA